MAAHEADLRPARRRRQTEAGHQIQVETWGDRAGAGDRDQMRHAGEIDA